jgi:mediator of DNA damage checkpoint protein 1
VNIPYIDESEFVLCDQESEKQYEMNLKETLRLTQDKSRTPLLDDVLVYATASVRPPPEHLKEILESAGGKVLFVPPKKYNKNEKVYIIGDENDVKECESLSRLGYKIYSKELILTGILKQELDLEGCRIMDLEP